MATASLNMAELLPDVYELTDMIVGSIEMQDYLYWKRRIACDSLAQQYIDTLGHKKAEFEDVQRFGNFHPNYHEKKDEIAQLLEQMSQVEAIAQYKAAEDRLDKLLYHVSRTIGRSISHTIKIPRDNDDELGGCGSSGCGSGGCGSGG